MQPIPPRQWVPPGQLEPPPPKGRGLIVAGGITLGIAILASFVSTLILGRSFDPDRLTRDVVLNGAADSELPGQVGFRVIEDLSSDDDLMSVGLVLDPDTGALRNSTTCRVLTVDGEEVPSRSGSDLYTFLDPELGSDSSPFIVVEDLQPGEYSAVCEQTGEPSDTDGATFTVGRVMSASDLLGLFTPVLGVFAAIAVGAVVGLVGLVLLVIGLVMNSRSRRGPPQPPGQQGFPPGGHPPGGYGPPPR